MIELDRQISRVRGRCSATATPCQAVAIACAIEMGWDHPDQVLDAIWQVGDTVTASLVESTKRPA